MIKTNISHFICDFSFLALFSICSSLCDVEWMNEVIKPIANISIKTRREKKNVQPKGQTTHANTHNTRKFWHVKNSLVYPVPLCLYFPSALSFATTSGILKLLNLFQTCPLPVSLTNQKCYTEQIMAHFLIHNPYNFRILSIM